MKNRIAQHLAGLINKRHKRDVRAVGAYLTEAAPLRGTRFLLTRKNDPWLTC